MEKLGQDHAFAAMTENEYQRGLSKRLYIAIMAMQGLLASGIYAEKIAFNPILGKLSFEIADELLKQENL